MITRTEKTSNYTILPNEFLLDETISDKARGLLARLLSRPDNWRLNVNYLVKTGKSGHTAVRSAIRELEAAGYIQKEVSRHANGRIIGVEYIIRESPVKPCVDEPAQEPKTTCRETRAKEDHTKAVSIKDNHMRKTQNKKTAPIIKTDIKQTLRETTTTAPGADPGGCDSVSPSSCSCDAILNLIPEKHKSPMVVSLVNKAVGDYPARTVKEAVAYAAGNVRGGSMQFKAYLDKALKNKWAEGYLESRVGQCGLSTWLAPRGKFPNGTVTGSKRMDSNYMAAAQFLTEMGVEV
nr:hypothetical protein [uncultured Desulfobacter sp.]